MSSTPVTAPKPPAPARAERPRLVIGGREIPVVLPSRRDPRLHLSLVIGALQVLGQTVLEFKVSVAQILITIGFCAVVEVLLTLRREQMLVWPASGMLTGNSIAFILRASGTQHGDWWSLNGIEFFILAAALSLMSKHLIRPGGRHLFNPSNVGLVWVLLVIGPVHVFPQYLWWGPVGAPVIAAMVVIVLGAAWILRTVRMWPMAATFLAVFWAFVAVFAAAGNSFIAIWRSGPIEGWSYWLNISLSPELFIFVFFMMTDPQTTPRSARGRIVFGAATALVAASLVYFQQTEYGVKVAILASLTVVCALAPMIEALVARRREEPAERTPATIRLGYAAARPVLAAAAVIVVGAVAGTAALAENEQVIFIERGLTGADGSQ